MSDTCKGCGAEVLWTKNAYGKWQILDPKPSPKGNIRLEGDVATVLGNGVAAQQREAGEELYIDHHATCPAIEQFRSAKRK